MSDSKKSEELAEVKAAKSSPPSSRPKYTNNVISAMHFFPANQLVNTGANRIVTVEDLWELSGDSKTDNVWKNVRERWAAAKATPNPSLSKVLFGLAPGLLAACLFYMFLNMMAGLVPSIVLPYLINWLTYDPVLAANLTATIAYAQANNITIPALKFQLPIAPEHPEEYWGWIYAAIIGFAGILAAYFESHGILKGQEIATRVRAGIMLLVYDKALSANAMSSPPAGKILNLLTSDVGVVDRMMQQVFQFIMTPLQLIAILVLLWRQIGPYALISLAILLMVLPFAGFAGKKMFALFRTRQGAADSRVKLISELIGAIRIVKYYAWEKPMGKNIAKARDQEISVLRRVFRWLTLMIITNGSSPVLATGLTFIFYGIFEKPSLTSIFTALNLLLLMRLVFIMLPSTFQGIAQILASIGRVQEYLMTPDAEQDSSDDQTDVNAEPFVELKEATFAWNTTAEGVIALKNISMRVDKTTRLTMVAGLVGSGKSALAQALLKFIPKTAGQLKIHGTIAYVPQTAWIMNASVKNNVLFGKPFDQARYEAVIQATALESDLKLMPAGDATEIGERGVNLSGGQKQRISIARALYADCDVILMDDPLSAVDAHVGKHIFNEAIQKFLKDKLVILITNNLQFLPDADEIVYLDKGEVVAQGAFKKLLKKNERFKALMDEHGIFASRSKSDDEDEKAKGPKAKKPEGEARQYQTESKESGAVSAKIYAYYIKAAGITRFIIVCFLFLLLAGSQVATQWWLQYWPTDYFARLKAGQSDLGTGYYIGIYTALNFVGVIFTGTSMALLVQMVVNAARRIHKDVISATIRAPVSFFDTTPMGRIIARFSTDLMVMDTQVIISVWQTLIAFFNVLSGIGSVALGTYWILIAVPPFVLLYWYVQFRYRKTSIEVQRLESLTRAPLFSHFSETLNGINTIRAYGKEDDFFVENRRRLEIHNSVFYALRYTQSWFTYVLGLLGAALQIIVFFIIVALKIYVKDVDSSLFVIAISAAPSITFMLKMLAVATTMLEVQMNAVERIEEYTHIPQEPPAVIEGNRPPKNWPDKGAVEFDNFSYRYRDGLPLVLQNVSISIRGGERIGIVGRTGSGKSTLLGALYRLAEPASGRVVIDGIDTTTIGVEDLRSQLSIIPQEPQLFVGNLRYNLDPFAHHSDEELWEALSIAGLKEFVSSLQGKLEEPVTEGGTNYSVGQRQLICLARALLRKSKILVLDEATASVDFDTDVLIQKAIRSSFPNTTLLVIAHRLNTVMDMNKILGLQAGKVMEYDSPSNLVKDKNSMLYGMIEATGKATAKHLKKLALGESDYLTALHATKDVKEVELPVSPEVPRGSVKTEKIGRKKKTEGTEEPKEEKPKSDKKPKEEEKSRSDKKEKKPKEEAKEEAKEEKPKSEKSKKEKK